MIDMCDDYPEIVGTDTLKRCWVLLRSSTTSEDLGNVCRLLDADLRPLTPDNTCKLSREIFEEHKQIAEEYLKVQTEIALLSQHKNEMLKNLSLDSLRQQQELRKLEDEKESLVKLWRVNDRARRFGKQRLGGGTSPSRSIEALLKCCDLTCSRFSMKSVFTLHDPDDQLVMCNADGIMLRFQSNFVRINTAY